MFSNSKAIGGLMLKEFITSALIIDDNPNEVSELKKLLEENDIWTKHYIPDDLNKISNPINNRKIIFLDLFLDEGGNIKSNVAKIRRWFSSLLGTNFGSYGIVLWTKHDEELSSFKEKIYQTSGKYTPPLFVIAMDKTKYLRENKFDTLFQDLDDKLMKNISSSFFIEWNKAVKSSSDSTIYNLYSLFDCEEKSVEMREKYLETVMYELAIGYSGLPKQYGESENIFLQKELIKSLMDTLQFEIIQSYNSIKELFKTKSNLNFELKDKELKLNIFSKLNKDLLLDSTSINQEYAIPGTIYKFNSEKNENSEKDVKATETENNKDSLHIKDVITAVTENKIDSDSIDFIMVDISPPCDFSNSKKTKKSRTIEGAIVNYNKKLREQFKQERFYLLQPIYIDNTPKTIIFDFYSFQTIPEDELLDKNKYTPFLRIKSSLFSDVLQKLSSHTARIGLSMLYP